MTQKRRHKQFFLQTLLVVCLLLLGWLIFRFVISADQETVALSDDFGIHAALPSIKTKEDKQKALDLVAGAGFGWIRHEFFYEKELNYENYDLAQQLASEKGLKTLGVIAYAGRDVSMDTWRSYVDSIVSRYATKVAAWQIMNEVDSESIELSPQEYVAYLKEAHAIIKKYNPNAPVVLAGITTRPAATIFWEGLIAAGGEPYFDAFAVHHYHELNPENVKFGNGDIVTAYSRPIAVIRKHNLDKKVWITETGYIEAVGREQQSLWLPRALVLARSIPEIEKVFVYRLANDVADYRYGLVDEQFKPYSVYDSVKLTISRLVHAGVGKELHVSQRQEVDDFESIGGWKSIDNKHAQTSVESTSGPSGNALQLRYAFDNDSAYASVEKNINLREPQAIGSWFKGSDDGNVVKLRFVDVKGEVFQIDIGSLPSVWTFKKFTIADDQARVSWAGDGKVDYPIRFQSYVVDRQSGAAEGTLTVDELTVMPTLATSYAYQFQGSVLHWASKGTDTITLCGESIKVSESIGVLAKTCTDNKKVEAATKPLATVTPGEKSTNAPSPIPTPSSVPTPLPTAAPSVSPNIGPIDPAQSIVTVTGDNVPANGYSAYRVSVQLRDSQNQPITDTPPVLQGPSAQGLRVIGPIQAGDGWVLTAASYDSASYRGKLTAANTDLKDVEFSFLPVIVASERPNIWSSPLAIAGIIAGLCLVCMVIYRVLYRQSTSAPVQPVTQELLSYMQEQFLLGKDIDYIRTILIGHGWQAQTVEQALVTLNKR